MSARNLNSLAWSIAWDTRAGRVSGAVQRALLRSVATLRLWVRRMRHRSQLRAVLHHDAHFFLDIGVSRATVYKEAGKWFWQA